MKSTKNILVLCCLLSAFHVRAQGPLERAVNWGERVPDMRLNTILNFREPSDHLSDVYRGKLLILDFWSTWCSVCINQFPRFEALQQKYEGKVMIMTVGFDAAQQGSIIGFVKKRSGTKDALTLPTVVVSQQEEQRWDRLFPHTGMPTEVWIDSSGRLLGITDHRSVTDRMIDAILHDPAYGLPRKPVIRKISPDKPLFFKKGEYGSVLKGYIDSIGVSFPFGRQYDSNYIRLVAINTTLYGLYLDVYGDLLDHDRKRILLVDTLAHPFHDFKDMEHLEGWTARTFLEDNCFCYELLLPRQYSVIQAKGCMARDLDRFFRLKSRVVNKEVNCLALVRTSDSNKIRAFSNGHSEFSANQLKVTLRQASVRHDLLNYLDGFFPNDILVDRTGYEGRVDMDFDLKSGSREEIEAALHKYDLSLVPARSVIPVLVLSDK